MSNSYNDTDLERRMMIRQAKFLLGLRLAVIHILFFSTYGLFLFVFDEVTDLVKMQVFFSLNFLEVLVLFYAVMRWHNHYYLVRPDKILTNRGVFLRRQRFFALRNVESITVRQGVFGRVFGFGSLQLYAPTLNECINMYGINDPCMKQAIIERLLPNTSKNEKKSKNLFVLPNQNQS